MTEHKEQYWSKFAFTYSDDQDYVVGKTISQLIINRLSEEHDLGDVIEFGCGTGYFTKEIAKKARNVIATDLSDEMLEIARIQLKESRNINIQKANCEDTYFPSGRFDTVFMANLIHILINPIKALQESHQILRNGGLLIIVDFTGYSMKLFEKMKLGIRYLRKWGMPPRYARNNLSPDELASLVENMDFKVEEVQIMGDKTKALYIRGRK
ncbi:MAG: methyltransferase domain-containing protein [Deltaproteobacteria bacterium]|nr:methyltransferase domain-containing protein [Deltaproteobacteria bacterium]